MSSGQRAVMGILDRGRWKSGNHSIDPILNIGKLMFEASGKPPQLVYSEGGIHD